MIETDYVIGEQVWVDMNGRLTGHLKIKNIRDTVVMKMVSFEEKDWSVGVCYVKRSPNQENGAIHEYVHEMGPKERDIWDEGYDFSVRSMLRMGHTRAGGHFFHNLFFRPDQELVQSIVNYADNRLIIDVGCGSGVVTGMLKDAGAKVCGIDPYMEDDFVMNLNRDRIRERKEHIQLLRTAIEDIQKFYVGQGNKVLLMVARPCHSDFVYNLCKLKDKETELLYIGLEKNIEIYNDLREFQNLANKINLQGSSADDEIFYSLF